MIPFVRRHATTIVLTLAALAALVVVLLVDRGSVSTNEATMRKKNLFDAWRADDVTAVTLRARGHVAKLTRDAVNDAGQRPWDVEIDGARHPAEEQVVDQLLGALEFAQSIRRVAPGAVDRAEMGLAAPVETVDVDMPPLGYELTLGGPAASPQGARYAEVKGKGVFVVPGALADALDARPDQLRSRQFIPYFSVDLAEIDLDGRGGARRLERAPWSGSRAPSFRFAKGSSDAGVRVGAVALDKVLTALASLSAEVFLTDDEAKASRPDVTVTLTPLDAARPKAVIAIGGACPRAADADGGAEIERVVAVRTAPSRMAVCVPKEPIDALAQPASALVDLRAIGAAADEVTEVAIASGDRTLDLARSGAEWHMRKPADRRVDAETGRVFLGGLLGVEGTALAPGHAVDARSNARIVSLSHAEGHDGDGGIGERVEELTFGEPDGDVVYVRRSEDGAVIAVPLARAVALTPSDLSLRPRKIVDETLAELRTIRVEGAGFSQRVERREGGQFELIEPKLAGVTADAGLASDLAAAVALLTADRWIADKDDGTHALDPPRVTVTAEFRADESSPPRVVTIVLGASTDAGFFAARKGTPGVFVAPYAFADAAERWLVDRGALSVDAATITAITFLRTKGDKPIVKLARRGDAWSVEAGKLPADADAASFAALFGDLVAEGAITLGPPRKLEGLTPPALTIRVARAGADDAVITLGAGDTYRGVNVVYARREGVDATFAVARDHVQPLLDLAPR